MSRLIAFRSVARLEFDEAVAWYEKERNGLGLEFMVAVDQTLDTAARQPELFRKVRGPIRRAMLMRFPYTLHFIEEPNQLVVVAVFHGSRDPRQLRDRK